MRGSVRNEKNWMSRIRVVNAGRSVAKNAVAGCGNGFLNLVSGAKKESGVKMSVVAQGRTLGLSNVNGQSVVVVVGALRNVLLLRPKVSLDVEKKASGAKTNAVALGRTSGSWIVSVRLVAGIAAVRRGGARGLSSSAVGRLTQRTGLGIETRKRFVVGTGEKERKPTSGSWIVNVQNVGVVAGRGRVALWRKRLKGSGVGVKSQFVAGIVKKAL